MENINIDNKNNFIFIFEIFRSNKQLENSKNYIKTMKINPTKTGTMFKQIPSSMYIHRESNSAMLCTMYMPTNLRTAYFFFTQHVNVVHLLRRHL